MGYTGVRRSMHIVCETLMEGICQMIYVLLLWYIVLEYTEYLEYVCRTNKNIYTISILNIIFIFIMHYIAILTKTHNSKWVKEYYIKLVLYDYY